MAYVGPHSCNGLLKDVPCPISHVSLSWVLICPGLCGLQLVKPKALLNYTRGHVICPRSWGVLPWPALRPLLAGLEHALP